MTDATSSNVEQWHIAPQVDRKLAELESDTARRQLEAYQAKQLDTQRCRLGDGMAPQPQQPTVIATPVVDLRPLVEWWQSQEQRLRPLVELWQRERARFESSLSELRSSATEQTVSLVPGSALAVAGRQAITAQGGSMRLPVKKFTGTARSPERAHEDDAGLDLFVDDECVDPMWPGDTRRIYLGVGVEIPAGHVGMLLPRSSTSLRGLLVHTGVIDAGFRGQLAATVTNLSRDPVPLPRGTKLAQLVIVPVATPAVEVVEELGDSERGAGGYGSTNRP